MIVTGSGNVFADLGLSDPERRLADAQRLAEFIAWESDQDLRYEYYDGKAHRLPPSTQRRSLYVADLTAALHAYGRERGLHVLLRPRLTMSAICEVRYPDLVLDAGPLTDADASVSDAVVIIDVGRDRDWSTAPGRYLSVSLDQTVDDVLRQLQASMPPDKQKEYDSQVDAIVSYVMSSARLEGQALSPESVATVRRIAGGEMSDEQIRAMKRDLVERLRNEITEA